MPEDDLFWIELHRKAANEIEEYFMAAGWHFIPLKDEEINKSYSGRKISFGWSLLFSFPCGTKKRLHLLIDKNFPYSLPRVALEDKSFYMKWPHVEEDGILCLGSKNSNAIDNSNIACMVFGAFRSAYELIEACLDESCFSDFDTEFNSYWCREEHDSEAFLSLLDDSRKTRKVMFANVKDRVLVCDDKKHGQRWINNFFTFKPEEKVTFKKGVFLWLSKPLRPPYPKSGKEVLSLIKECAEQSDAKIIGETLKDIPNTFPIFFGFETKNGPALGCFYTERPKTEKLPNGKEINPITNGFRPGKIPFKVITTRYLSKADIKPRKVDRVDHAWLHGRAVDETSNSIRNKSVAIIGLGAVGSFVAAILVKAGVGNIVLIDDDKLSWVNIGRHVLGAQHVGKYKSRALSEDLRRNHPNLNVIYDDPSIIQSVLLERIDVLQKCDIIIDLTADWIAKSILNEFWHRGMLSAPLVFGWTERFGVAGHAIALINKNHGCYQCGCNFDGGLLNPLTNWPEDMPVFQEPACGTVFQPYGPTEQGFSNSLISNLIIDVLMKNIEQSVHRVWVGPKKKINHYRGCISDDWKEITKHIEEHGGIVCRNWERRKDCPVCGKGYTR
ncbi:MAG: ThiF family adenylyltransferase [Alphaproteobacteria bacterium]